MEYLPEGGLADSANFLEKVKDLFFFSSRPHMTTSDWFIPCYFFEYGFAISCFMIC